MDTIPVYENGNRLKFPWVGGHNYCQFSDIDVNFDGKKDLFVFDRTGNKVNVYINGGTPNQIDYTDATYKFASKFPYLEDWALLVDYNCDGKKDIFTYAISIGGIKVWKNTSSGGNLQFTLQTKYILSSYPTKSNLYCSRADLPAIEDIDGDGDMDILTFDFSGISMEYHVNKSIELGYGCDSLIFEKAPSCWGNFSEELSTCGINLNSSSCQIQNIDSKLKNNIPSETNHKHAGNCSLCLDMDGDGDKDLVLGQISCCNLAMVTNGGTVKSAFMTAKDTSFPSGNIPVGISLFPCGFFVDVNNDNKRDLIVAPNAANVSNNNNSIWYYENVGTDNAPIFLRKNKALLQNNMIDIGEGADPILFDFDKDGLTDILITNYSLSKDSCKTNPTPTSNVFAYKNTGTVNSPEFNLISTDFNTISAQLDNFFSKSIRGKHLTFGDIDGDGAEDMYVGDYDGFIHFFKNNSAQGKPVNFILTTPNVTESNGTTIIDVGSCATPQLVDVDRDGDLDLLIGEKKGNINYYENIGTTKVPSFAFKTSSFGGIAVMKTCCSGYSVPFLYDSAGSYRLLVASEANNQLNTGWIWHFKNIDGNLTGNFTMTDSLYKNIWEGLRMTVYGKDINNDGNMDLIIGNYSGGITFYMNDSSSVGIVEPIPNSFDFEIYPNPSSGTAIITISNFSLSENYSFVLTNITGEVIERKTIVHSQTPINNTLKNGIYFCEVRTKNYSKTKKLISIK